MQYQDYLQDFYGTIIETLESREIRRRAVDRVRALYPDMKEVDVDIQVSQIRGSAVFDVRATGVEPKYTRVFLDALLDEFVAFRNQIREQQRNKALTTLAEDVVRREKNLQVKLDKLVKSEQTGHIVIGNGPAMQSLQKLKEDRDAAAQLAAELALWLEDVKLGVEQREAKQTNRSSSSHDDLGAGLTLNEREYLGTQQALR